MTSQETAGAIDTARATRARAHPRIVWRAMVLRVLLRTALGLPAPLKRAVAGRPVRVDGQQLDLDFQLLRAVTAPGRRRAAPADVAAMRAGQAFFDGVVSGPPEPGVRRESTTVDGAAGPLRARLYVPLEVDGRDSSLLVFFHGGGFVAGSLDSHDGLCAALAAEAGVRVLSVEYRLAPEYPFPAAVDDALAAFRHVVAHPERFGTTAGAVAVGGDSAGGSLAITVAHETTHGDGPAPVFVLAFFPVVDLVSATRSRSLFGEGFFLTAEAIDTLAGWYVPAARREDPRLALGGADPTGLPPAYVATAGFDPLRDEAELLVERMRERGVAATLRRHPDLVHGFATTLGIGPRPRQAVAEAAGALRTALTLLTVRSTPPAP